MKPRVLITGINGKIGQAIVSAKKDDWDIVGLDIRSGDGVIAADVSEWDQVNRAFAAVGDPDYVVHLAAVADSRASWNDVLRHNIVGTRNVYERSKNANVKKVLFASSWHVVGAAHMHGETNGMISPKDPVRPDGDYATSKVFGEALARQYYELHGLHSICLRIGNVEADDKPRDEHAERIWLSHRDLVQLVTKGFESDVPFGIYFATSANDGRFLDLSAAERELGYEPRDNGATRAR